jgi:hypothetical protein
VFVKNWIIDCSSMLIGYLKAKLKKMRVAGKVDIDIHLTDITIFLIDMRGYLADNTNLVLPRLPPIVEYQTLNILARQVPAREEGHEPKRRKTNF